MIRAPECFDMCQYAVDCGMLESQCEGRCMRFDESDQMTQIKRIPVECKVQYPAEGVHEIIIMLDRATKNLDYFEIRDRNEFITQTKQGKYLRYPAPSDANYEVFMVLKS